MFPQDTGWSPLLTNSLRHQNLACKVLGSTLGVTASGLHVGTSQLPPLEEQGFPRRGAGAQPSLTQSSLLIACWQAAGRPLTQSSELLC